MKKPNLKDSAMDFYARHSPRLKKSGHLTESTHDAFILLARTWGELVDLNPHVEKNGFIRYFALLKWFQLYARGFGMNTDKIVEVEAEGERTGEFEY